MSTKPKAKQPEWIWISKYCVNKGRKRVGVIAKRVSDFWIMLCDECQGKTITLDCQQDDVREAGRLHAREESGMRPSMASL